MATIGSLSRLSSADDSSAAAEVVRHDDTRLSDDRDPTAHASTHATAGSDPVSPADIGAATSGHNHTGIYQPADSDLTAIAALSPADGHMIRRQSGVWVAQSMADVKTALALAKGDVGLGNVDNTSDANKPVSAAVQDALDALRHIGVTQGGASSVNTVSTSYVTLGSSDLATTFTFPPSGRFTVMVRTSISCSSITLNHFGVMSFEVRSGSAGGSQLFAAGDDWAAFGQSITANEALNTSSSFVTLTGFPTSGTGYIRAMYRSTSGSNTATFAYRSLLVIPST